MIIDYARFFVAVRVPRTNGENIWTQEINVKMDFGHLTLDFNEKKLTINVMYKDQVVCIVGYSNLAFLTPRIII